METMCVWIRERSSGCVISNERYKLYNYFYRIDAPRTYLHDITRAIGKLTKFYKNQVLFHFFYSIEVAKFRCLS